MKNELYLCGLFFKSKHFYFGILTILGLTIVSVLHLYFVCARFEITDYNIKPVSSSDVTYDFSNQSNETVDCQPRKFEHINNEDETKVNRVILILVNLILYLLTSVSCCICAYSNPGILSDYRKVLRVSVS